MSASDRSRHGDVLLRIEQQVYPKSPTEGDVRSFINRHCWNARASVCIRAEEQQADGRSRGAGIPVGFPAAERQLDRSRRWTSVIEPARDP